MSGDMPCHATCHNAACHWCAFGECLDNATCDEQMNNEQEN